MFGQSTRFQKGCLDSGEGWAALIFLHKCFQARQVHKNIFARLTADEAEALGIVEPLYCSLFQFFTYFHFEFLLRRIAACEWAELLRNLPSTAGESN